MLDDGVMSDKEIFEILGWGNRCQDTLMKYSNQLLPNHLCIVAQALIARTSFIDIICGAGLAEQN